MDQMFVNIKAALVGLSDKVFPDWVGVLVSIAVSIVAIALLGPLIMMYLTLI